MRPPSAASSRPVGVRRSPFESGQAPRPTPFWDHVQLRLIAVPRSSAEGEARRGGVGFSPARQPGVGGWVGPPLALLVLLCLCCACIRFSWPSRVRTPAMHGDATHISNCCTSTRQGPRVAGRRHCCDARSPARSDSRRRSSSPNLLCASALAHWMHWLRPALGASLSPRSWRAAAHWVSGSGCASYRRVRGWTERARGE